MKRFTLFIALIMLFSSALFAEKPPQSIVDLAKKDLEKLGSDPIIVKAVLEQNAKNQTLEQVKKTDKDWMNTPGVNEFMKSLMNSEAGKHLAKIKKEKGYIEELFIMDHLGANVAMSDKTSDYWQGDEPKFTESYKDGKGATHIGEVKFDASTQSYLVQVSVPVRDKGKVIGAITIGVNVDKVK